MTTRIALIHALAHSIAPINAALVREWPEAIRMNLLDDSLSTDLAHLGTGLNEQMTQRFLTLTGYAVDQGAQAVLFTCSAFGRCIDAVRRTQAAIPILKPNEAMIDDAVQQADGRPIGLVASFAPTLQSMPGEFPPEVTLRTALAEGALAALEAGDGPRHDLLVAEAARRLEAQGCAVIALAQFSLARAGGAVAAATGVPVLTAPSSAVQRLRMRLRAAHFGT